MANKLPLPRKLDRRLLTSAEFFRLRDVPPEAEWIASIGSPGTQRIYRVELSDFTRFAGVGRPAELRLISRAHVIAYREELARRGLQGATIRRKLSALSSLYEYLRDRNAVAANPVKGVARPKVESYAGKTPALSDAQVRALLTAPRGNALTAIRERAILAFLLYHALRREELCRLRVTDIQERRGVRHLRVYGKGQQIRHVPLHPAGAERIAKYLQAAGHGTLPAAPLIKPVRNNRRRTTDTGLTADGVYQVLKFYGRRIGVTVDRFGPHSARATAATNALERGADLAKVPEWLGHANISTTRVYDHRKASPADSPVFRVNYSTTLNVVSSGQGSAAVARTATASRNFPLLGLRSAERAPTPATEGSLSCPRF